MSIVLSKFYTTITSWYTAFAKIVSTVGVVDPERALQLMGHVLRTDRCYVVAGEIYYFPYHANFVRILINSISSSLG